MRIAWMLIACAATSCGGDVDENTRPSPLPEAPSSTPPPAFTPAELSATAAQCGAPHGDVERYTTVDELVRLLAGAWYYCPGGNGRDILDSIQDPRGAPGRAGLELTSDGHVYWLSADGSGTIVRGRGMTEIAGYEIEPPSDVKYNNDSFAIYVKYPDGSTMSTRATFEKGPRRLSLQNWSGFFVPFAAVAP